MYVILDSASLKDTVIFALRVSRGSEEILLVYHDSKRFAANSFDGCAVLDFGNDREGAGPPDDSEKFWMETDDGTDETTSRYIQAGTYSKAAEEYR